MPVNTWTWLVVRHLVAKATGAGMWVGLPEDGIWERTNLGNIGSEMALESESAVKESRIPHCGMNIILT